MRTVYLFIVISFLSISCKKDEEQERVIERSTVTDVEGTVYQTVKIGNQWWMAENLKVGKFRDGSAIPYVLGTASNNVWADLSGPARTFAQDTLRGFLYNFEVVQDERGIAPEGWRVPTDEDWKILERYIGMEESEVNTTAWRGTFEGSLLASRNSLGWGTGSMFGSDEYGFNAIPAGCRIHDGRRNISGEVAFWWTSSTNQEEAWYRYMDSDDERIFRHHIYRKYGMSIRCIKE